MTTRSRVQRTVAGLVLLVGAGWSGTAVLAGLLLQAFSCPTSCAPDVAGLLTGTGVLITILALGGLGLYLLVTAVLGRTDPRVGSMATATTAAIVPVGLLVVAADSTGLEPIAGQLLAAAVLLLGVAGIAAARGRLPTLRATAAGAAGLLAVVVLAVLTLM